MKLKLSSFGPGLKFHSAKLAGWLAILSLCCMIVGCGKFFVSNDTLVGLALSPTNPTVQPAKTQQMVATGTYGDSSTKDVSAQVTWTSSAPGIATINTSGLATAVAVGTTTLTAALSGQTASTTLTISNKVITSITISPTNSTLITGSTEQFSASATFSDGTSSDITSSGTWSSGNTAIATINSSGLATGVATGTTTISVTSGGVTNTTNITVD